MLMPRHYFVIDISLDKDRTETLQNTLNSSENTKRILDKLFNACLTATVRDAGQCNG